ncbi:MAG: hypothetical protein ACE5DX_02910 [Candidatus Dojkabacteria bacterium]
MHKSEQVTRRFRKVITTLLLIWSLQLLRGDQPLPGGYELPPAAPDKTDIFDGKYQEGAFSHLGMIDILEETQELSTDLSARQLVAAIGDLARPWSENANPVESLEDESTKLDFK